MRFLWMVSLISVMVTSAASACSNPMSKVQLQKVVAAFKQMTPGGDGFRIDRCRNITLRYGKKVKTGKLHQLFTELNSSHHDTTYLGLIKENEWWVYGSGGHIYIYHPRKTKRQSADWMVNMNADIVRLLKLAGYAKDPHAQKRATILKRDLKELGSRDFGESVGVLLRTLGKYAPSGHQSVSKQACLATKKACRARCQGFSNRMPDVFSASPKTRCLSQCTSIQCY